MILDGLLSGRPDPLLTVSATFASGLRGKGFLVKDTLRPWLVLTSQ